MSFLYTLFIEALMCSVIDLCESQEVSEPQKSSMNY